MRSPESKSLAATAAPAAAAAPDECFEEFYRREFTRAVQLAWLLTHSRPDTEDLVQEAFVTVHARFADLDNPAAYLRVAVVNRCRTWHRRHRLSRDAHELASAGVLDGPVEEYLVDAIAVLPYRQRVVVVARYWGGWTEAEIARVLECRPGTVKSLASRALTRLRKEVDR